MKPHYAECRNCGERIVFAPFWRDGREPNPPIWWHPPGGRTCNPRRYQILSAGDRRSVAMHNLRDTSDVKRP